MKIKHIASALTLASASLMGASAQAADLTLELTNLTRGINFTPRLVVAHTADVDIFQAGTPASTQLAEQAEGGSTAGLEALLNGNVNSTVQKFGSLLGPGEIAPYATMTVPDEHAYLTMTAMMLPTNDGFIGIDSWKIPTTPGTYFININAYDAGSEANDELRDADNGGALGNAGFPGPETGQTGGTGVNAVAEGNVHIHRGNLGDTDANGGASDIDSRVHRWLNPVARLKVVVQ